PRLTARLDAFRALGVNCPKVSGYQMVADAPPSGDAPITEQIRRGLPSEAYGKTCVFDPRLHVAWGPGKHHAPGSGCAPVFFGDGADPLKLLHYRYLGRDWLVGRNARNYARLTDGQKHLRLGVETYPGFVGEYSPEWYADHADEAQEVVGP